MQSIARPSNTLIAKGPDRKLLVSMSSMGYIALYFQYGVRLVTYKEVVRISDKNGDVKFTMLIGYLDDKLQLQSQSI